MDIKPWLSSLFGRRCSCRKQRWNTSQYFITMVTVCVTSLASVSCVCRQSTTPVRSPTSSLGSTSGFGYGIKKIKRRSVLRTELLMVEMSIADFQAVTPCDLVASATYMADILTSVRISHLITVPYFASA